jgi:hypothetical protein
VPPRSAIADRHGFTGRGTGGFHHGLKTARIEFQNSDAMVAGVPVLAYMLNYDTVVSAGSHERLDNTPFDERFAIPVWAPPMAMLLLALAAFRSP